MKNYILRRLTYLLLMIITLPACTDADAFQPITYSLSANVNGQEFYTDRNLSVNRNGRTLSILGEGPDGERLHIILNNFTGAGTYPLGGQTNSNQGEWELSSSGGTYTTLISGTGYVNITSSSIGEVEGDFTFEASNGKKSVQVSEGKLMLLVDNLDLP